MKSFEVAAFDIVLAERSWRGSTDVRPWLLVRPESNRWLCFAISTKDYDSGPFELPLGHPDFPATGLKMNSYIYDADAYGELTLGQFKKRLGRLEGTLLQEFRRSAGV